MPLVPRLAAIFILLNEPSLRVNAFSKKLQFRRETLRTYHNKYLAKILFIFIVTPL
jgi:hypothetical protein